MVSLKARHKKQYNNSKSNISNSNNYSYNCNCNCNNNCRWQEPKAKILKRKIQLTKFYFVLFAKRSTP